MSSDVALTDERQFVAWIWWKGCMSIKKASFEQFTRFFNRLYKLPRRDLKLADEVRAEAAPAISSNKSNRSTAATALASQDLYSSRGVTTKELERYYAKPGEAEWGC